VKSQPSGLAHGLAERLFVAPPRRFSLCLGFADLARPPAPAVTSRSSWRSFTLRRMRRRHAQRPGLANAASGSTFSTGCRRPCPTCAHPTPHHSLTPASSISWWIGRSPLRHGRGAAGPAFCNTRISSAVTSRHDRRPVRHVLERCEDYGACGLSKSAAGPADRLRWRRRGDRRTATSTALRLDRIGRRLDDALVDVVAFLVGEALTQSLSRLLSMTPVCSQRLSSRRHCADAAAAEILHVVGVTHRFTAGPQHRRRVGQAR